MTKDIKSRFLAIGLGALLYVYALYICEVQNVSGITRVIIYMATWLILIAGVCKDLVANIRQMKFFDENLLMLLATIGALIIGRYPETIGAILFFEAGKVIEIIAVNNVKKSIAQFVNIRSETANLKMEDGTEKVVHPCELKTGQTIIIKPGEKIPVDATVLCGTGMADMKVLTGESVPKAVYPGKKLYSGSINLVSMLEARVEKIYEESTASRVMELIENAAQRKAVSESIAVKFRRLYMPIVTILGVMVMVLPPILVEGHSPEEWMYRGMVFFVSACPVGLLVSVPLAFLGGIGAASKQGVLIKGSDYLEALAEVETVVFDKTGTLTEGVFKVKRVVPAKLTIEELLEITAKAEVYSNHPIAVSLQNACRKKIDHSCVENVKEYSGFGVTAQIDGDTVCVGNRRLMERFKLECPIVDDLGTVIYVAINGEFAGYIVIGDQIRPDVKKTIRWLHKQDIETVMLTGDNRRMAKATGKALGIRYVYGNLMPEDKLEKLEEFIESQREDEKIVFVGDGINDAPVLARADVGIVMGGLGADAALEAADVILMKDQPSRIINAIRISKATIKVVKQNMIFSIGMKVFMLVLALFGLLNMRDAVIADMCVMAINILNSFWVLKYPE
ncbi:MAG: heavy metal translocating P-type ATPase [Schaedlerella sp.]|nr:heavy metal translocating P-type ATPase [Schaedlerella sp.]